MEELRNQISRMLEAEIFKIVISKPVSKTECYKKIVIEEKQDYFQASKYTEKQVFHENIKKENLKDALMELIGSTFRQVNAWSEETEYILLISKKGKVTAQQKAKRTQKEGRGPSQKEHNRKKHYILEEGQVIEPLVDMGVFTAGGAVVTSMYDKFKQINRFLEIIDDEIKDYGKKKLNVIDFGCGKSYLTFVLYYYLTNIRHLDVQMVGLDLKADVIEKCNAAAKKYGYEGLRFELGDINGYETPFDVDMVVTLHACDTATDYALYNAIQWKAKMIFSVPCCQHELNKQMKSDTFSLLGRYGIIKERFSALATDAIRGNLLEYCGYRTQLLEFVDFAHTPKNILIRAVRKPVVPEKVRQMYLKEVTNLMEEFQFEPTLYRLLTEKPMAEKETGYLT